MILNDERFLTIKQAAERVAVSERSIWNLVERGVLRVIRPGGLRVARIRASEIERLMKECAS